MVTVGLSFSLSLNLVFEQPLERDRGSNRVALRFCSPQDFVQLTESTGQDHCKEALLVFADIGNPCDICDMSSLHSGT